MRRDDITAASRNTGRKIKNTVNNCMPINKHFNEMVEFFERHKQSKLIQETDNFNYPVDN